MLHLTLGFLAAFVLSILLTRAVRGRAAARGLTDKPDGLRRLHVAAVPRLGGVGIFGAVAAVLVTGVLTAVPQLRLAPADLAPFLALQAGAIAIFALGLWDDVRSLRARTKLIWQVIVAVAVFTAGLRIESLGIPGEGTWFVPMWLGLPLTVVWLVGITNAFNLIDGSDGVAAGAALFTSVTMAIVFLLGGNELGAVIALAVAGATLGFLFFNFPPASIFLGDSGALFLGFILGGLGIMTVQKAPTAIAVAIPVVSCGLPVLDTLLAMLRRFLRGEPILKADRGHIHHRLRDLGHSPRTVALLLYAACAGFALIALVLLQPSGPTVGTLLFVTGLIVWLGVQRLHIPELIEVGRVVRRGLAQRHVIANNVRVREAAEMLRRASTPTAVIDGICHILDSKEFAGAELWLADGLTDPFQRCGLIESGDGHLWTWSQEGAGAEARNGWEARIVIHANGDEPMARLSLWPGSTNAHILTDMRLLALVVRPEMRRALWRISQEAQADSKSATTSPAPAKAQPAGAL